MTACGPLAPVLLALLVLAGPVRAKDAEPDSTVLPVYSMPVVRTTAPAIPPAQLRPGSRTVLDRSWLERTDPTDLAQALLPVAGLRVVHAGDGVTQSLSIRGLSSDRVAVLVDGRALNTAQGGGVDLQPLDLEEIERVEITRGAMGALYGPDALGGSVNLVRTTTRKPGGSLRLMAGTDERALFRARYGGTIGRWSADAILRAETSSQILAGTPAHSSGRGASLRVAYHPTWAGAIEAGLQVRDDQRDVPGTRYFPTPEAHRQDRFGEFALSMQRAKAKGLPGMFDFTATLSGLERRYQDFGNSLGPIADRHENRRGRAIAGWKHGGNAGNLEARVEAVRDRLESTADGNIERDRAAVALQGSRTLNRTSVALALRLDAVESFGPEPTLRASLMHTLTGSPGSGRWLAVRAGGGTSFRPPTFDDLFWPARAGAVGNPDLLPEHAYDLDLGVEAQAGASRGQISVFQSRVGDLIQWTPGPDGVWRPHNVSSAHIRGLELEGSVSLRALAPLRLDASYSRLQAVDDTGDRITGGKHLVGRAQHQAFGELSTRIGRWSLASGLRAVSRVPLTAANTKWAEGYLLWHGRVRVQVVEDLRFDLEGRNLLDTDYEDLRGYATPGREILFGLRYSP